MFNTMTRKKKIVVGACLVALLAVVVLASLLRREKAIEVQAGTVAKKEMLEAKVTASGEVRARMSVDVQPEVAGVITEVQVREGDRVSKGQLLLRIDPVQTEAEATAARAQLEAARAEVESAQAQLAAAETGRLRDEFLLRSAEAEAAQVRSHLERARASFMRKQQLLEAKLLSQEEFDIARAELRALESQHEAALARVAQLEAQLRASRHAVEQLKALLEAARSRVSQARAQLTRATDLLSKTAIFSPLDGVITRLNVEPGERAVPGIMSNPQAILMTIADMSIVEVEVKVDETDIVNVALKNRAKVTVDALAERELEGEVVEIGSSPIVPASLGGSSSQEGKDFKVVILLKQPPPELRPGMSATAEIITAVKRDVLTIPLQALTVREVEVDGAGNYIPPKETPGGKGAVAAVKPNRKKEMQGVFVIDRNRRARFRPVRTGLVGGAEIEVVDGLREGEQIITGSYSTLRTLKEGAALKVKE